MFENSNLSSKKIKILHYDLWVLNDNKTLTFFQNTKFLPSFKISKAEILKKICKYYTFINYEFPTLVALLAFSSN